MVYEDREKNISCPVAHDFFFFFFAELGYDGPNALLSSKTTCKGHLPYGKLQKLKVKLKKRLLEEK